jgi:hypothetical protein
MPAKKPAGLITRAETKADKAARIAREDALKPSRELPKRPPTALAGHKVAQATWRRSMATYLDLEASIVTRLDLDLLVDYCLLMEQVTQLDEIRGAAYQAWSEINRKFNELCAAGKPDKEKKTVSMETVQPPTAEELGKMATRLQAAMTAVKDIDGRADRKRSLLLQLRQSLYLTPRSRAGTAPVSREDAPEVVDPMEQLLGQVTSYVNGESGHEQ